VSRVLALVAAPRADTAAATEFLRVLAAARAVGREVAIVEVGRGVGALSAAEPDLTEEGARTLAALAEDGVVPRGDADPAAEMAAAEAILVLPDPARTGMPPVLRLRRGERPASEAIAALATAGQIVLG